MGKHQNIGGNSLLRWWKLTCALVEEANGSLGKRNNPSGDPSIDPSTDPCIRKSGGEKEGRQKREISCLVAIEMRKDKGLRSVSGIASALTEARRPDIQKEISKRYSSRDTGAAAWSRQFWADGRTITWPSLAKNGNPKIEETTAVQSAGHFFAQSQVNTSSLHTSIQKEIYRLFPTLAKRIDYELVTSDTSVYQKEDAIELMWLKRQYTCPKERLYKREKLLQGDQFV